LGRTVQGVGCRVQGLVTERKGRASERQQTFRERDGTDTDRAMPLIQVFDVFNEALDLWLSPNHEGQRRYVRQDDLLLEQTGKRLGFHPSAVHEVARRRDVRARGGAAGDVTEGGGRHAEAHHGRTVSGGAGMGGEGGGADAFSSTAVLCTFIPNDEDEAHARKAKVEVAGMGASGGANRDSGWDTYDTDVVRIPVPSPTGHLGTLAPIPSLLPHPDHMNMAQAAGQARIFSSEAGVPTIFVTRPSPHVVCRVCSDVYADPVIAHDGFTYCRTCTPSSDPTDADGYELGDADLAQDHEVWEKILCMQILCRNGVLLQDNPTGISQWVHNSEGCVEAVAYAARAEHEAGCGFARVRCGLPHGRHHNDSCDMMPHRYEREEHQAQCHFRLVSCQVPGCDTRVQHNRRTQHASLCAFKVVECPVGCGWQGRRSEAASHRAMCDLELVTCARADTQDPSSFCSFMAERRFMDVHAAECEYRALGCPHCGRSCSARHAAKHEEACSERRVQCERCGAKVLARRMPDHEEHHCGQGLFLCEFAKYGCTDRGSRIELDAHCEEDAPRHLRLVMLAVEGVNATYKSWYAEVDGVRNAMVGHVTVSARDIEAAAAEVRRVEAAGKTEVEKLRVGLADLRAYYEEEVGRLHRQVGRRV